MPLMIKDGRAVLFIHIPKTGGSTIERLFTDSGWEMHLHDNRDTAPTLFPYYKCSPQHLHASVLRDLIRVRTVDLSFAVVRDPVRRFRSEFAHRHVVRAGGQEIGSDVVEAWGEKVMARYARNQYALDNHLRPQAEFIVLPETEVYRLEDGMEAMVADLNARYDLGLPTEVPHRLRSGERGLSSSDIKVSPRLRARLKDFYAVDYDTFGYPR